MKRAMVWTLMLAVGLLLGAPAQAMTEDEVKLNALYNAIFIDQEPGDEEPVDVDGDGDIDADDYAAGGNIYCCTAAGACVSTSKEKCLKAEDQGGYGGTDHNTLQQCKAQPGCRDN